MNIKTLTIIAFVAIATSGCHMYGDQQIKPHHHTSVHKVVLQKAHTAPKKPAVYHHHPANHYTKVVNHSHPGGNKPHKHNYGKSAPKNAAPKVLLVKVVSSHGHHRHHRKHH